MTVRQEIYIRQYIGKLETKLSNSRFIFFYDLLLSSNDGSLETTVSSVFAKISNSTGKEVDFRSTVNVVCAILLLIDMPGTRYRYFWSSSQYLNFTNQRLMSGLINLSFCLRINGRRRLVITNLIFIPPTSFPTDILSRRYRI